MHPNDAKKTAPVPSGRAHDLGRDLVFRRGFKRTPPVDTLFLHRKFVGTFMLCTRRGARIDLRGLAAPWVGLKD